MKTLLALALGLLAISAAARADDVKLPATERFVLGNGTIVILNEMHEVPLIGLEAVIRGGAVADPDTKHGVAALLAELLEKGAAERSAAEFAESIAAVGGELSADAGLESLTVSAEFLSRDTDLMVELVADLLQRPTLSEREFVKLRDRSIDLIKAAKGSNPSQLMAQYANAFLFGEHPYGNPVGGSESSLAAVTHDDVQRYYQNFVGADRLVIAVSGDFNSAQMRTRLSDAFGEWRAASEALPQIMPPSSSATGRVFLIDKPFAAQTYFYVGGLGVARSYAERAELDLANTVFGGRFTSMLMTELRIKSGLSYGARSALSRQEIGGSVFITSFTQTAKTMEAITLAVSLLQRLHDNGLDEAALDSARNYVMGQYPPRFETSAQLAATFAYLEAFHLDSAYVNDYGRALAATTTASVADVIADVYPTTNALVFVILGDADALRDSVTALGEITELSIDDPTFHP